jgi:hypothetical protein
MVSVGAQPANKIAAIAAIPARYVRDGTMDTLYHVQCNYSAFSAASTVWVMSMAMAAQLRGLKK